MNLLVLANNLDEKGGTNRVTADLVHYLSESLSVSAATVEGERSAYPYPEGVSIHPLQPRASGKLARTLNTLRVLPKLAGVIRRQRAEVVMSFLTRANLANVLAQKLFRLPCATVICERNYNSVQYAGSRSGRLLLALMRAVYPRADLVIANADALAEDLHRSFGVARDRIRVVHNPFDLEHIHKRSLEPVSETWFDDGIPVFLNVGRLIRQKNQALLLNAFAAVRRTHPCRLVILGEGDLRENLEKQARELGIEADVKLAGWRDNPYAYMGRARAFVLSSDYEGFPNVVVEAMASGTPVVSTDCPSGPAEILGDSSHGLLVPLKDERELSGALKRLIEDEALVKSLRERSLERARCFSGEKIAAEFRDVLEFVSRRNSSL